MTIALMLALAAGQASWPDAGGWGIGQFEERCLTNLDFEGEGTTELSVSLELDGSSYVIISNLNWTTVEDRQYPDASVTIDDVSFSGGDTVGTVTGGYRRGLMMKMPVGFVDQFAQGSSFKVHNGDQLVDSLDLKGSAAATSSLRRCINVVRREHAAAERERQRLAHIPKNPFADQPPTTSREPVTDVQWARQPRATADDFPARALEREISGSAVLSCTSRADGSVANCRVVSETPAGMGFGRAAIRVVQRAQLSPVSVDAMTRDQEFRVTMAFSLGL